MKRSFPSILVLILIGIASFVHADFAETNWQWVKNISLPDQSASSYVQVKLDSEVYRGSSLSDLRVVASNGSEVPYQLIVKESTYGKDTYPVKILNQSYDAEGRLMFVADLGESGLVHNKIGLAISTANFKRTVHIGASDQNLSVASTLWRTLTDNGYIFKFTDPVTRFTSEETEVPYPNSTSRFVRVIVENGEGGSLSLSGASVYRTRQFPAEQDRISLEAKIGENTATKATEFVIDMGAVGIPTKSVEIEAPTTETFSRQAVVETSPDGTSWRSLGQGYIFRIKTTNFNGSNLIISYPETNARYYRIIVFNQDNQPVNFSSTVIFTSVARRIVFEAGPNESYKLYYGNPNARAVHYDITRFFQYLETDNFPEALLGLESINSAFVAPQVPKVPFTERYPYLLNSILFVAVLIMAVIIFFFVRKNVSAKSLGSQDNVTPQGPNQNN